MEIWNTFRPRTFLEAAQTVSSASFSSHASSSSTFGSSAGTLLRSLGGTFITSGFSASTSVALTDETVFFTTEYGRTLSQAGSLWMNSETLTMGSSFTRTAAGGESSTTGSAFTTTGTTTFTFSLGFDTTYSTAGSTLLTVTTNSAVTTGIASVVGTETTFTTTTTNALTTNTATAPTTSTLVTGSSTTSTAPLEMGTVVSAGGNWVWSWTAAPALTSPFKSALSALSGVAASFTQTTFWSSVGSSTVSYATHASTAPALSFTVPAALTTVSTQYFEVAGTSETTITTGDSFSRDTITTMVDTFSTTVTTDVLGQNSAVVTGYESSSRSVLTSAFSQDTFHTLLPFGFADETQTTVQEPVSALTSVSSLLTLPAYVPGGTTAGTASTQASGQTLVSTASYPLTLSLDDVQPFSTTGIVRDTPWGAFGTEFGTNINFGGGQVLFPFTSSILSNVVVPVPVTSTFDDGIYTWSYHYDGSTLSVSQMTLATILASSTGTFSTVGTHPPFFAQWGGVLGGYGDVSTATATAYIPRGGVTGTSIATNGGTTTFSTLRNATASQTAKSGMIVERTIPVFVTNAVTSGALTPYTTYVRNFT